MQNLRKITPKTECWYGSLLLKLINETPSHASHFLAVIDKFAVRTFINANEDGLAYLDAEVKIKTAVVLVQGVNRQILLIDPKTEAVPELAYDQLSIKMIGKWVGNDDLVYRFKNITYWNKQQQRFANEKELMDAGTVNGYLKEDLKNEQSSPTNIAGVQSNIYQAICYGRLRY